MDKQFSGLKPDEAKRNRELELDNQGITEMPAVVDLDERIQKTALEGNN
ncbi:hypothetical protein N9222_02180 [Pseudomonadales bacterium]|nr:hypothetical protein [Pseudomonadales bacterium]